MGEFGELRCLSKRGEMGKKRACVQAKANKEEEPHEMVLLTTGDLDSRESRNNRGISKRSQTRRLQTCKIIVIQNHQEDF